MFDCHTHVQFPAFEKDRNEVIERARAAGISIINVGTSRQTSIGAVELARHYAQGVYATVGLHPTHTAQSFHDQQETATAFAPEEFDKDFYRTLAKDEKVVAIGECGLDYYRPTGDSNAYKDLQKAVFLEHVKIAQETGKALMIHCRPSKGTDDAYDDLLSLLLTTNYPLQTAVLHFYVGSMAITKKFLDAGFNFEFGGVITFARSYDEQIKIIPLDRIVTETDAPYVTPEPHRGQRNEPTYLTEVVKKLAQIKGISYDEMATATHNNAQRLFKII